MATKPKLSDVLRSSHASRLAWAGLVVLLVHVVGTFGYKIIGGAQTTWLNSFYMTFVTVATIGYGEIIDLSNHPWGRVFTVFIAFTGIATMTYMFSNFTAIILESDLNQNS